MQSVRDLYTHSATFRNSVLLTFVGVGAHGKLYEFAYGGERYLVRHNFDGSYTWM